MRLWLNWSWNNGAVTPAKDSPEFSAVWAYTPVLEPHVELVKPLLMPDGKIYLYAEKTKKNIQPEGSA